MSKLPSGWRVYSLNELVDTISGYAYKGKELVEESEKTLVTLKSFNRNGGFQTRGFKPFIGTPKEEQKVVIGDLVVAHTDLTQDAEVLGNPAFIFENAGYKEMYITMDLVKVLSVNENIDNSFLYYLMKDLRFKGHCVGYSNGTTVLYLSKKAILEYRLALPEDLKLAKDFSAVTKELTNKISNNIIQIQALSKAKETLLPKLMSGEIKI
jgi:type I restriction enzyme, S subunit